MPTPRRISPPSTSTISPLGAAPVAQRVFDNLASTTFTTTFDLSDLPDGRYGVHATVFDHDGALGTDDVTFQHDSTPPNGQIASPSPYHASCPATSTSRSPPTTHSRVGLASGIVDVQVSIEGFGYQSATALPTTKADTWVGHRRHHATR